MNLEYKGDVICLNISFENNRIMFNGKWELPPVDAILVLKFTPDAHDIKPSALYKAVNALLNKGADVVCGKGVPYNKMNVVRGFWNETMLVTRSDRFKNFIRDYSLTYTNVEQFLFSYASSRIVQIDEVFNMSFNKYNEIDILLYNSSMCPDIFYGTVAVILTKNPALLVDCVKRIKPVCDGRMDLCIAVHNVWYIDVYRSMLSIMKETRCRVQYFVYDYEFNYSKIHNEILMSDFMEYHYKAVLINDDILIHDGIQLENLMLPIYNDVGKVGVTGCRLLFPNGTIQHVGVETHTRLGVIHSYRGLPSENHVSSKCYSNPSAVTFALAGVNLVAFRRIGGFEEALAYDFNDIDLCIRMRQAGYDVLYVPECTATHLESATRKLDGKCGVSSDIEFFKKRHIKEKL